MGSLLGFGLCLKQRTSLMEPEALLPHKTQGALCPGHHLLPSPDAGSQIRCRVCAGWSPLRTKSPHPPPGLEEEGQDWGQHVSSVRAGTLCVWFPLTAPHLALATWLLVSSS